MDNVQKINNCKKLCNFVEDGDSYQTTWHHILEHIILRKIWGFHGGDYEESSLLGCGTV
jgi:hypothetical protein